MNLPLVSRARYEQLERQVQKLETWKAQDYEDYREQRQEAIGERGQLLDKVTDLTDKLLSMRREGFEPEYPAPEPLVEPTLSPAIWEAIQAVSKRGTSEYGELVRFAESQEDHMTEDGICETIIQGLDIEI